MALNNEEKARKIALAEEYAKKIDEYEENLRKNLSAAQIGFCMPYVNPHDDSIHCDLAKAMNAPDTIPSEYIRKKLDWLFDSVIPDYNRQVILYFADRLQEYPYSDTYQRRSFRAKRNGAYVTKLENIIRMYRFYRKPISEPLEKILARELPEEKQAYLDENAYITSGYNEWQVAYALDHNNSKVENAIRSILLDNNSSGMVTQELIRGILISHRSDFHELLGKLLLAARLQEGLRQIICEAADCGTKEGYLAILKVIDENNLIRYSSVKRAVGTWLGLLSDEVRDLERVSDKSLRLIIDCLENEKLRDEYLASEDAMKVYVALWSYAFHDIDEAFRKVSEISQNGSIHKLLVSGYFAANSEQPYACAAITMKVLKKHSDKNEVLAIWLPFFKSGIKNDLWESMYNNKKLNYSMWFDSKTEAVECYQLIKGLYYSFSGKTKIFSPCVFPWYEAKISKSDFAEILCAIAVFLNEKEINDEACTFIKDCSAWERRFCFSALLRDPQSAIARKTVLEGLADRENSTREEAYEIVCKLKLTADEYRSIESYLRFKGADIRKNVINILLKQNGSNLQSCITRLLSSEKEEIRLGGLDMLLQLKKDENNKKYASIVASFDSLLCEIASSNECSSKEKILLDSLVENSDQKNQALSGKDLLFSKNDKYIPSEFDGEYTKLCVDTFADYFPESKLPQLICGNKTNVSLFEKIKSAFSDNSACESALTAAEDLLSLSAFIDSHRAASFVNSMGETILIGNLQYAYHFANPDDKLPLHELWQEWAQTVGMTNKRIIRALLLFYGYEKKTNFTRSLSDSIIDVFGAGFEKGIQLPYSAVIQSVLESMCVNIPQSDRSRLAFAIAIWFIRCVPDNMVLIDDKSSVIFAKSREKAHLLAHEQLAFVFRWLECKNNDDLQYTFPLAVACAQRCISPAKKLQEENEEKNRNSDRTGVYYYPDKYYDLRRLLTPNCEKHGIYSSLVGIDAYLLAAYRGIITIKQLYEFLFDRDNTEESLETVTAIASCYCEKDRMISKRGYSAMRFSRKVTEFLGKDGEPDEEDLKLMEYVFHIYEAVIPIILSSELSRGDSPVKYSDSIMNIARIYGADYLVQILSAMGNDTLDRTAYYGWGSGKNRKTNLSYLLSVCIPANIDSSETLKKALAGKKISEKRLIEAAMFSPEWIPIIGQYLGIDSFESACYYFMAHMNESFDDKRKAVIAKYTPLSDDELNLGAFDVNWFRSAYSSVGEKKFDQIYDAAKYISDGAKHSRARKYADATLGKLNVDEIEKIVSDKRNQDLLMAYALIPLEGEDDILRRYLYIRKFLKESKQFGSQRSVSEAKAANTALTNLAINAGYSDSIRLTLRMETKVIDDSRNLFEEQTIDSVSLKISTDEKGKASISASKNGKQLKSIPASLKKNETVHAMSDMVKALNEQYRRTRTMFENAMEDSTIFTFGELSALSAHPVVYPMLRKLLLISGDTVGFLNENGLADDTGNVQPMAKDAEIRIAHPFDLYSKGIWKNYQKYIFENQIVQPFRQVFRELYIKTDEEKNTYHSLRYAGNQIQPAKAVATLKGRRWVADLESGLQKVYYKENIIAQIYALANWFSPSDIEAPTLEWVCFSERKTGKELKISDIPDIIFSEVMRDVDLAVSVAHVGGVDPETSHSTTQMRAAILSFVLPLFRIENVRVEGHHAIIDGKLAEYSVHLGSGVVHQLGGAMIPVLPVHSQHRGRIFLPFVDDDPKTAEIISKVLLFAEDDKIKDPMILSSVSK